MCTHLNNNNERDCENEPVAMCLCCGMGVCEDHIEKRCPYGGELYVDIEEE